MTVLKAYIERFGRPLGFYTDFGVVFNLNQGEGRRLNRPPKTKRTKVQGDQTAGCEEVLTPRSISHNEFKTQFSRALDELQCELILAHSPQAKGRVERCFSTLQDRLVFALRFHGIKTIEAANDFLENSFIAEFNRRFGREPNGSTDVHRPSDGFDLEAILSYQDERYVNNDYTFRIGSKKYQILVTSTDPCFSKKKVIVERRLNGRMAVRYNNKYCNYAL
jgi:hypothetical protein